MNLIVSYPPVGWLAALFLGLNTIAGLVVIWTALCTLNYMSPATRWFSRIAYVLIGAGAAAMLLAPFYFKQALNGGSVILLCGVAVLLVSERFYTRKLEARYARRAGVPKRHWIT